MGSVFAFFVVVEHFFSETPYKKGKNILHRKWDFFSEYGHNH